jgi:hypothetical protein
MLQRYPYMHQERQKRHEGPRQQASQVKVVLWGQYMLR